MTAQFSALIEARAECHDCGWFVVSANAQAVGAKHATYHGHLVMVDITRHFEYATRARWTAMPRVIPPTEGEPA